jgi:hypothetical protein
VGWRARSNSLCPHSWPILPYFYQLMQIDRRCPGLTRF